MKHPLTLLIVAAALIAGCSPTASKARTEVVKPTEPTVRVITSRLSDLLRWPMPTAAQRCR